jgi:hypothetical protein
MRGKKSSKIAHKPELAPTVHEVAKRLSPELDELLGAMAIAAA